MSSQLPEFYTLGPYTQIDLGFIQLPTYYTVISLTYCICITWFYNRCEERNLSPKNAMDIGLIVLIGGFVGARIFHILFELPAYYIANPLEIFYFWQGGYVFYGGLLSAYFFAFLYARRLKLTFWLWHDTLAPVAALGYALGRLACFLNGCCYGKVCDLPWAMPLEQVHVVSDKTTFLYRHPTQLYATAMELGILSLLIWYEKRRPKLGNIFLVWLILHSLARIIMETFRVDPRGAEFFGLSLSTSISIFLIAGAVSVLWSRNFKNAKA